MRAIVYRFIPAYLALGLAAVCGAGAAYTLDLNTPGNPTNVYDYAGAAMALLFLALVTVAAALRYGRCASTRFAVLMTCVVLAALGALGCAGYGALLFLASPLGFFCDAGETCIATLHHLWTGAALYLLTALLLGTSIPALLAAYAGERADLEHRSR